ncbi:hypothetical protein ABMA28_014529 [Loxostege sticticalis]|uniref:Solute carrier family 25 member 35 n=1 Tax=Loxostege sticticalis TaxID=481309 RepID=A0ABD0TH44_LOXSC
MDFLIGGLAGAGATIVTNPMDVVKTRMQLQGELRARGTAPERYKGIFHAVYVIAKADGLLALQRGLAPAMWLGFTMNSVRLGGYHTAISHGWTKDKNGNTVLLKAMLCSSISGMLSGLTGNPAFMLKTRIQASAHPSIAVGRQHRYKGLIDGIRTVYRTEGLKGFFAGVNATCLRLAVGSAAQLPTFTIAKEYLIARGYLQNSPMTLAFVASLGSGVLCVLIETPLDVANTRLYNQASAASGKQLYSGVMDCLTKIYKTEGLHGMYKGLGPLYLRIAPHTTLSLVIWDTLNNVLLGYRKKS